MKSTNLYLLSQAIRKNQGLIAVGHLFRIPLLSLAGKMQRYENALPMGSGAVFPFTIQAKKMSGGYHA
ncbi:hypothetical protein [Edaphobacter albus]|uniref:hypothetical protein n=1 Tax=Edaphobacter sp. 4G125 TaxID=2763071 RepID=UPI0016464761|nr:hypothetical protein [Edaphobacter sp. 4G125]QNI36444.1 hypothetical protein H7846_16000 [Edaphobacter sp. 4G125]